jgi:hypothetical protein
MKLKQRLWRTVIVMLAWLGVSFAVPATSYKIEVVAGNGTPGYSGDGGFAVNAQLNWPLRLTFHKGDLYIPERFSHVIRKVNLHNKKISTVAGQGGKYGFQDGPGLSALFNIPSSCIFLLNTETMYVSDSANNRLRQILHANQAPEVSTLPEIFQTGSLKTDRNGHIYIVERDNHRIRKTFQRTDGTLWG